MNSLRPLLLIIVGITAVAAQDSANPSFEVASVKPNKSGDGRVMMGFQPGGRYSATGITVRMLINQAYRIQPFQLLGGPDWLGSDRFDIIAKAEGDIVPGPTGPLPLMLRSLLADRFKLAVHTETREMPVYALVKARSDGRLGPQLTPSEVDCAAARGRGGPPPSGNPGGPGAPGFRGTNPPAPPIFGDGGRPPCGQFVGPANIAAGGVTMAQLANLLSGRVQRIVVDRTGMTGNYDLELSWTPDQMPQGPPPGALPQGVPSLPPIDPNGPSLFTAIQEQLGLKLESTRGPVDVVVIDRVERPTED